jgi:hypothetical protein
MTYSSGGEQAELFSKRLFRTEAKKKLSREDGRWRLSGEKLGFYFKDRKTITFRCIQVQTDS